MTTIKIKNQSLDGLIADVDLGDFKASWAGEFPPCQGFAFGAEDGRILLMTKDGQIVARSKVETDESINGLAFLPNWVGISTRNEVHFLDLSPGQEPTGVLCPYGAHGVIVGPQGHFLAPLGRSGLLLFKPAEAQELPMVITRPREAEICCYAAANLTGPKGEPVIALATRRDGIAALPFDMPERGLHTLTYDALDAIDVCSLATSSLAVAALGKDGTIMLCRDVIEETIKKQASVTIRFADIRGTAYRILNAMGHLVVFTSQATYFLGQMASNFLAGKTGRVTILEFPVKAVDANVVNEHWLFIVTSHGVLQLDLRRLPWDKHHQNGFKHLERETIPLTLPYQGRSLERSVEVVKPAA